MKRRCSNCKTEKHMESEELDLGWRWIAWAERTDDNLEDTSEILCPVCVAAIYKALEDLAQEQKEDT